MLWKKMLVDLRTDVVRLDMNRQPAILITIPKSIGSLLSYDYSVSPETLTQVIARAFKNQPSLPGVLICENSQLIGMVSRRKCLETLSYPYGVELFLNRPITHLFEHIDLMPTVLAAEMHIQQAVQLALGRPSEQLYEPIIVNYPPKQVRLLDLHTLLLAQSQLLENANHLVQQQADVGRALSSTLELQQVLELILHHLNELVSYDRAGVMLQIEDYLKFVAWNGFPTDMDLESIHMPVGNNTIVREIYQSRTPLLISDLSGREDWIYIDSLQSASSWLGLPLLHSGQVIGILSLVRTSGQAYNEDELTLAQTFADQAAIALKNASLFNEVKNLNQNLETIVHERTKALQNAYEQLEHLDRAKSDFITITSHELRTPLTVISGYAQMLAGDSTVQNNPFQANLANGILAGTNRLSEVMTSMLDVAKIDHRQLNLSQEDVDLTALLKTLCAELEHKIHARHLKLTVQNGQALPAIQGDESALRKAFSHLINNAIKFTPDGGQITLSGHIIANEQNHSGHNEVEVIIADSGIGIAPQHLELIFTKFYQTGKVSNHSSGTTKFKGGGPGLGLAIVRGIVEAHGGRAWAESPGHDEQALPGSQFHVRLPVDARKSIEN